MGTGITGGGCGDVPAYAQAGTVGGARFRIGSLPIVVHATDADSHDTDYPATYLAHSRTQALAGLESIGARVITIQNGSGGTAETQLREISETTRAVVPVCAFKNESNWQCGENTCCEGTIQVGTGADSDCILRYSILSSGAELGERAVDGIDAMIKYTTFDVYAEQRDDGKSTTPATDELIEQVVAIDPASLPSECSSRPDGCDFQPGLEPERSCNPVPTPDDITNAGYDNGFRGFAVGSSDEEREGAKLFFTVHARNTTVPETLETQSFVANVDIIDDTTGALLDTQQAFIIVPAMPMR